jgi:hypothetical protein
VQGSRGGPLFPLASQLNHDMTRSDSEQLKGMVAEALEALARLEGARPAAAATALAQLPPSVNVGPSELRLDFHVDPQFVHRQLASQALGADEGATIGKLADQVTAAILDRQVPDIRVMAIKNELATIDRQVVTVRSGFYFRRTGSGSSERIHFHDNIRVDEATKLRVEGEFDPHRFEANSAWGNLSGRQHVFIAGVATEVEDKPPHVVVRPLLIGLPYFAPAGETDSLLAPQRPEVFCWDVDQFRLDQGDRMTPATDSDLQRLFKMPEQQVKEAFGRILGLSTVPADWGGEHSDLVADLSVRGVWARAAFAFKGPGGKPKPWTLYPANMGLRGDQSIRLFAKPADVMVVQHCAYIAEAVRHFMDALATLHHRRYMLLDGDHTVRILKKAGLLA